MGDFDAEEECLYNGINVRAGSQRGGQGGHNSPGAKSLWGHWITAAPNDCGGRRKVPTMSQVLSSMQYMCFGKKDLRFEHGGAKLASCPRCHLTSLRPCSRNSGLCGCDQLLQQNTNCRFLLCCLATPADISPYRNLTKSIEQCIMKVFCCAT